MNVILKGTNQLYLWDRDKFEIEVINPNEAELIYVNRIPTYKLKKGKRKVYIVQALNEKRAVAKFLTILTKDGRKKH